MGQQTWRVRIDAKEFDRGLLIQKLNEHGADHHIKFEFVNENFDYRIAYGTGQAGGFARACGGRRDLRRPRGTGGLPRSNRGVAVVSVLDPNDRGLPQLLGNDGSRADGQSSSFPEERGDHGWAVVPSRFWAGRIFDRQPQDSCLTLRLAAS